MKKYSLFFILLIFLSFFFPISTLAKDQVEIYFFYGQGCPHCAKEEEFLGQLEQKYDFITVKRFEVYYNSQNKELMEKLAEVYKTKVSGVPMTFICDKVYSGYASDETTGQIIENCINNCRLQGCTKPSDFLNQANGQCEPTEKREEKMAVTKINLPIIGQIDLTKLSLPVLSVVIGLIDGFNPCAMWALMFLLALLIGTKSKKKIWYIGGTFVLVSGIVYFIFMTAWLNFFLLIGYLRLIQILIGTGAFIFGVISFKNFFKYKEGECKVTESKTTSRSKIINKIKALAQPRSLPATLGGVILLALAINLVELFCSAGFPAVYTGILAVSHLPTWQYFCYISLYIFFFMLDDLIIFLIAAFTLSAIGLKGKYARYSNLIGGLLILILGLIMLIRPELLQFG